MSFANKLKDVVTQELLDAVEAMLGEAGASPEVAAALHAYASSKIASIHELADAMADPEDEPELYRSAAFLWLELKSEWVRYNQTMQYQVARRGEADTALMLKGAACSAVLARIEPLLLPGDVDVLTTMSAEPLQFGRADAERVRRFLAHQDKVMAHLGRIFQAASQGPLPAPLAQLEGELGRLPKRLEDLASRYEQLLDAMIRETRDAMLLPYDLLWASHRQTIEDAGTEAGMRLQISNATSEGTRFDLRFARVAEDFIGSAARALLELVSTGDVGHANFGLTVTHDDHGTSYALWSDRVATTWAERATSPARSALLARLDRFSATAIMMDQGEQALVTISVPRERAKDAEHFLIVPGSAVPLCVPSSDVDEAANDTAPVLPVAVVDLCPPGVAAVRILRVRLGRNARAEIRCPMAPRLVRGLVLPSTTAADLAEAGFDFAVVSAAGVFGLLEAHVVARLRAAEGPLEVAA